MPAPTTAPTPGPVDGGGTASGRVRRRIGLAVPALSARFAALTGQPDFAARYPEYLVLLHGVVRASVPLMQAAVDRLGAAPPGDPLAGPLAAYLEHHIPEEQGHDRWLLDDLAVLGVDEDDVVAAMPSPHVAAAVGAQYYWIHHHHPVALLGYIVLLEGSPPDPQHVRAWVDRTGLPEAAFRTLAGHAELDPGHNQELDALIDALPLTPAHVDAICVSGATTAAWLVPALDDLLAGGAPEPRRAASGRGG